MIKMPETVPIFNEDITELIMPGTPDYKAGALKKGERFIYLMVLKINWTPKWR